MYNSFIFPVIRRFPIRTVVGSILHGAYGDLYEQAICLKHYASLHPEIELKLFAATQSRLESFHSLDLSFATLFDLWTEIEHHPDIEYFYQFQVYDGELNRDVLNKLPADVLAKIDRVNNILPWTYLRDNSLIPTPNSYKLPLSESGFRELSWIADANNILPAIWNRPTINFLWRYRRGPGAINSLGQKSQEKLVHSYSAMFQRILEKYDCHILVCGMNIVTNESNRELTDNKYPDFGLDLPAKRATYLKGLSWPLELEIASRATVCCGHASGFTEGLWLKRGGNMVLMDAPPHYLAKIAYHRIPFFDLDRPLNIATAFLSRSAESYRRRIEFMLSEAAKVNA
jgi:hypothetical protein